MAIEVALDIALGNQAAVPEKAAEAASEVWDVWDGSWNRPAMPPVLYMSQGARLVEEGWEWKSEIGGFFFCLPSFTSITKSGNRPAMPPIL